MKSITWIAWLVAINGIILLAATTHLRKDSRPIGRAIATILLSCMTCFVVVMSGFHHCDEGGAPSFVIFSSAAITGVLPWLNRLHPWSIRIAIALTVTTGMVSATYLSSSYHRDTITGNPKYSAGRFWHTPFTGQYPRDRVKTTPVR